MTRKQLFRLVIDIYVDFQKQITLNENYKFICEDKDAALINNFLDKLEKDVGISLGKNYLIDYVEYAFNYWYSLKELKTKNERIFISWIIGEKAYKRWKERHKHSSKYFVRCGLKKDVGIKQKYKSNLKKILLELSEADERQKAMFHNSTKGFLVCVRDTTLYNHKSSLCGTCKSMIKCKGVLEQEYPKLFKARGYQI